MFKINTRSNKFFLDYKNGGFYVNKDSVPVILSTYGRSVFYGSGGDKWYILDGSSNAITVSLGVLGISWATNSSWSDLFSFGGVVDYGPGYWTINFQDYSPSPSYSLNLRDDGYGLNYVGYTDTINYWLTQSGIGNDVKLFIDGASSYGIFSFSGRALVPGFRARMVLQEITNDDGTTFNPFMYYVFEFVTTQEGITILDNYNSEDTENNPALYDFLTNSGNYGWGSIGMSPISS